jgi:hypothetical protein
MIQDRWEVLRDRPGFAGIQPAIEAGLLNVTKWYRRMDDTDCYVLAMVLNPVIKFEFIRASWDVKYVRDAEKVVKHTVCCELVINVQRG